MEFGELLKKTLKENKVKITHLSSLIGMNRMAVYAVFNGEKKLPENIFNLILEKIEFSPAQAAELSRLYYINRISKERTKQLKTLKAEFESAGRAPFSPVMMFRDITPSPQGVFLLGALDYYSAVKAFLESETAGNECEIFTNYSFLDTQVDCIVYDFICKNKPEFKLVHTVRMDSDVPIEERLRNIFASVKFGKLGHPVFIANKEKNTVSFSTHFIGKKTVLQYDPQNECGFLSAEPAVISAYRLVASRNRQGEKPLTAYSDNAFELRSVLQPFQLSVSAVIEFKFPAALFATPDILETALKKTVPDRNVIFSAFQSHISLFQKLAPCTLFSQHGIQSFARTGLVYDASPFYLDPISLSNRKALLERYKKNIAESGYSLKILNSNSLQLFEGCELEIFESGFALMFFNDSKPGGDFSGGCYILLDDKEIADLFKDFYNYTLLSESVISQEYAQHLVNDLISQCEAAINQRLLENGKAE